MHITTKENDTEMKMFKTIERRPGLVQVLEPVLHRVVDIVTDRVFHQSGCNR